MTEETPRPDPRIGARIRAPNRAQLTWGIIDVESLLPADHLARAIWALVERLDLSALHAQIAARGQTAGAPAIDPRVLLTLWIYATSDGEGSAP